MATIVELMLVEDGLRFVEMRIAVGYQALRTAIEYASKGHLRP